MQPRRLNKRQQEELSKARIQKEIDELDLLSLDYKEMKRNQRQHKEEVLNNREAIVSPFLSKFEEQRRNWMIRRNKEAHLEFSQEYRKKIKAYFNSLKEEGQKSIKQDEIEEPLITLGVAKRKKDVTQMIAEIDEDGSGEIEFKEFLDILQGKNSVYGYSKPSKYNPRAKKSNASKSNSAMMEFFKGKKILKKI